MKRWLILINRLCWWRKDKFYLEVYKGKKRWRVRLRSTNERKVMWTEGYSSKTEAMRIAKEIAKNPPRLIKVVEAEKGGKGKEKS